MSKKEFPTRGHCLSTNPIIVNYLKDNFEGFKDNVYSKKSTGVAWNENKWWYISKQSSTPKYSPPVIIGIIIEINEMNNITIAGTLSTSSGTVLDSTICTMATTTTTDPFYKPYDSFPNTMWVYGSGVCTAMATITNLVTEPTKLRIKCRNLKKNLKVSLMQINLK
jgi:hypothetical protein